VRQATVKLSFIVDLPNTQTVPWEFGKRFFETLVAVDPRLMPEKLGWGKVNNPVSTIED
jgi:hypothetical protein